MSIDIVITQKALIKKTLPLSIILGDELKYGAFDGFRLDPDVIGEGGFIAYNPEHIGRGISIEWTEQEKEKITLRSLTPTNPDEIRDFFAVIDRICNYWKCELEVDGEKQSAKEFSTRLPELLDFNERSLKAFFEDIVSGKANQFSMFCTMWPLEIGIDEAKRFVENPEDFYGWMHERQTIDAYYAKPSFFISDEEGVLGRYVVTEDVRSIFPLTPSVPFGTIDPDTQKQLECQKFVVGLYSTTENGGLGLVPYEAFLNYVMEKSEKYDGFNIIFEGLTLEEMKEIAALA